MPRSSHQAAALGRLGHRGRLAAWVVAMGALLGSGCGGGEPSPGAADAGTLDLAPIPYTCVAPQPSPDAPGLPGDACDLLAQDCPAEHGCYPGVAGATCLPEGPGRCGGPCEYANDCPAGTACVGAPGRCRGLCLTGDLCPGGTECRPLGGRDRVGFCPEACHVLAQDCADDWACVLVEDRQECAPPPSQPVAQGQPCAAADACAPGLICQDPDAPRCLAPCSAGGEVPCAAGACRTIKGSEPLGVCVVGP